MDPTCSVALGQHGSKSAPHQVQENLCPDYTSKCRKAMIFKQQSFQRFFKFIFMSSVNLL